MDGREVYRCMHPIRIRGVPLAIKARTFILVGRGRAAIQVVSKVARTRSFRCIGRRRPQHPRQQHARATDWGGEQNSNGRHDHCERHTIPFGRYRTNEEADTASHYDDSLLPSGHDAHLLVTRRVYTDPNAVSSAEAKLKPRGLLAAAFGLTAAMSSATLGASLRPDKATDASVCDLAPNTTAVLGRKVFVPAYVSAEEASEAYKRLASRFIAASCSNNQLLILHSENSRPLDAKYLPNVAGSLCAVADIVRTGVSSASGVSGEQQRDFELRCRITKFDEFKADFEAGEKRDPTDDFISRLQKRHGLSRQSAADGEAADKTDCGKVTLSSILTGGNCR